MRGDHSTEPDKITGWKPRELIAKLKQFPLIFMNPKIDTVSKTLTEFGSAQAFRVIYMGPRHNSNMKAFKSYCQNDNDKFLKEGCVYGDEEIKKYTFKHQYESENFFPIRVSEYRLFTGMNPTFKREDLHFDADFECGNLDLAISIDPYEYDLVMRVDSNTKGHTTWFHFKAKNSSERKKVKLNIINFSKKNLMYKEGMRPYIFSSLNNRWEQSGEAITYNKSKFRYDETENNQFQCLTFTYEFQEGEEVYFSYCIPYSYSYLLHRIEYFKKKAPEIINVSYQTNSTGGLPIPILTISNFHNEGEKHEKNEVLCIARQHPGETQGSWMIDGFIEEIISPEGQTLREKNVFRIIPMVNVDGVVLGNFRTGIMGRDLNRQFLNGNIYNEISMIRKIAAEIKPIIFLDFHGHSTKRNVFIYGPNYKLEDRNYLICRLFPKMISKETEAFRYYSCSFQISKTKLTTGRAVMMNEFQTEFSYTVEGSAFGYGSNKNKVCFSGVEYQNVGKKIGLCLGEFMKVLSLIPKRQETKNERVMEKSLTISAREDMMRGKIRSELSILSEKRTKETKMEEKYNIGEIKMLSLSNRKLLNELLKDEENWRNDIKGEGSSDSDYEDETNDYTNTEVSNILKGKYVNEIKKNKKKILKKEFMKSNSKSKEKSIDKESYKEIRNDAFLSVSNKNIELSPDKIRLPKNKSFSKDENFKKVDLRSAETIEAIEVEKKAPTVINFEQKVGKLLERSQLAIEGMVRKKFYSRFQSEHKEIISSNSVSYKKSKATDWNDKKLDNDGSSKHFNFLMPEVIDPVIIPRRKELTKYKTGVEKYMSTGDKSSSIKDSPSEKRKTPIFSIRKSVLPTINRTVDMLKLEEDRDFVYEKIIEHENKTKNEKNVKVVFM